MEASHKFHVLWNNRLQFLIQHDIHISVLSDARGRFLSGPNSWLPLHVHLWWISHDCILSFTSSFLWVSRYLLIIENLSDLQVLHLKCRFAYITCQFIDQTERTWIVGSTPMIFELVVHIDRLLAVADETAAQHVLQWLLKQKLELTIETVMSTIYHNYVINTVNI